MLVVSLWPCELHVEVAYLSCHLCAAPRFGTNSYMKSFGVRTMRLAQVDQSHIHSRGCIWESSRLHGRLSGRLAAIGLVARRPGNDCTSRTQSRRESYLQSSEVDEKPAVLPSLDLDICVLYDLFNLRTAT